MASQPENGDVDLLMEFTTHQLSRDQAVRFLQISSNNLEAAANKFFEQGLKALDDANIGWDGSAFGANSYQIYGPQTESSNPTFNIEYAPGVDNYPHSGVQSGAPSRPPSRTSQRSGVSSTHLNDAPLQSIENQESGLTGNQGPAFGPATRENYDSSKWAMVPIASSTEFVLDAAPSARKREENGPVIIKPTPNENYLPALLTILHSIPLFRNALLTPQISRQDYWVGDDWWKGSASAPARTIDNSASTEVAHELDLIYETQRLMAFLDMSDRAYASFGSLLQLDAWKQTQPSLEDNDDELLKFLLNWSSAYQSHTTQAQLNGVLRSMVNVGGQNQESFALDGSVIRQDSAAELNLYDVLDETLFSSPGGTAHIVDVSNVLILRLISSKPDATSLDCKIPATFYADRYLEENKAVIDDMFLEVKQYKTQLEDIEDKAQKLKYHMSTKMPRSEQMDALQLLTISMQAFKPKEGDLIEDPRNSAVIEQLQSVYKNIERKIKILEEEKMKVKKALDSVSNRFKTPIDDDSKSDANNAKEGTTQKEDASMEEESAYRNLLPPHPLTHSYKLCGVSTRPSVFYLLHPDVKNDTKNWWRIEYSTATSEAYIFREQLTQAQVLEKASSEHRSALLVYANETATSTPPVPLATPLKDFVKKDNVLFMQELQAAFEGFGSNTGNKADEDWGMREDENRGWSQRNNAYPGWENASAKQYFAQNSGQSSTTLTPNTDMEDEAMSMEMTEVGGGGAVTWAGAVSNASSDTVGEEAMDIVDSQAMVNLRDVEMSEVDLADGEMDENKKPEMQHMENVERKGG